MNKIQEGQEVYYLYYGHRGGKDVREPVATTVTKVGRKYFEVEEAKGQRFSIETLQNDAGQYSSSSRIVLSIWDYRNEQEYRNIMELMQEYFGTWSKKKATLEQLREIAKILQP